MEPMTLGTPNTSMNASLLETTASGSQFLPSFLLGNDPANSSSYTSPKAFSPTSRGHHTNKLSSSLSQSDITNMSARGTSGAYEKHDGPPTVSLADYSVNAIQSSSYHDLNNSHHKSRDFFGDDFTENWVTIFGFSPSQLDLVLSYFVRFGEIIDKKHSSSGGNWIHVKYNNKREALSALAQNGKQISPTLMIGVFLRRDKRSFDSAAIKNSLSTTSLDRSLSHQTINSAPFGSSIRRLTMINNENEVVPPTNVPTKSSGVVSKAMEYIFGW